jgi:hypothetical protein
MLVGGISMMNSKDDDGSPDPRLDVADCKKWMLEAAQRGDRVGVVDSTGLLVTVGMLSQHHSDQRRLLFDYQGMTGAPLDVWLFDTCEVDEYGYRFVPMTEEREARWKMVLRCQNIIWTIVPTDALERILDVVHLEGGGS